MSPSHPSQRRLLSEIICQRGCVPPAGDTKELRVKSYVCFFSSLTLINNTPDRMQYRKDSPGPVCLACVSVLFSLFLLGGISLEVFGPDFAPFSGLICCVRGSARLEAGGEIFNCVARLNFISATKQKCEEGKKNNTAV